MTNTKFVPEPQVDSSGLGRKGSDPTELAVLGGHPMMSEPLHVGRPNIGSKQRILGLISDALDRRWLSNNGPLVQQFERMVCEVTGAKHCIAVVNGTIALEVAARAMGLSGQVILPSFTFVACAHAMQWQEIAPIFCDIESELHLIDPNEIGRHVTPKTTGVMGVHLWGNACAIDALTDIAGTAGLKVLFDGSHAFGSTYRGLPVGGSDHTTVFSFHATKFVNAFEGGAIVTGDDDLAKRIRLMINFGFSGYDNVVHVGTNGKMNEASAAMGIASIEAMAGYVDRNRRNRTIYGEELKGIDGIRLLPTSATESSNEQYVVLEVDGSLAGLSRDELLRVLHAERVLARRYFWPGCHRMEPYRSNYPHSHYVLPVTERVAGKVLVLPTGSAVDEDHVRGVCSVIRCALQNGEAVRHGLARLS